VSVALPAAEHVAAHRQVELAGRRLVQASGSSNEGRESLLIDFIVLVEVDCAPGVALVSFTTLLYVSPVQIGPW